MEDDDFVDKSSQGSASQSKSVLKDDGKFVQPHPVTPKKDRGSGRQRVSESDNSTAVAGNLTETDELVLPSREVTSAEEVIASQSECATEEDSLFSSPSPGRPEKWELVKTFIVSRYSIDTIFVDITAPGDNSFNNEGSYSV